MMNRYLFFCLMILTMMLFWGCSGAQKLSKDAIDDTDRGASWVKVHDGSAAGKTAPAAGEDAEVAFDTKEKRLVFYGGKTDKDETLNETWFYYPGEKRWEQLTGSNLTPPAREDHILIYDTFRHKAIMHGGEDGDTSNELWELDLATMQWTQMTNDDVPFIEDHTAFYADAAKGAYFFGGQNEKDPRLDDLWFLNLDPDSPDFYKWKVVEPSGKKRPDGRIDHTMVYDGRKNRILIYGGWDKEEDVFTNNTWAYKIDDNKWKRITPKSKKFFPSDRRHIGSVLEPENGLWIIFGGRGAGGPLNDIWAFDTEKDLWINATPGPAPRMDHNMFYNPFTGEINIVAGDEGKRYSDEKLHDMWKLNIDAEQIKSMVDEKKK